MRHLLEFEGIFVDFQVVKRTNTDFKSESTNMVQQVIENMMNTEAIGHLSSEEQEEYMQNSLRIIQELSDQATQETPGAEKETKCVDMFSLRVLSLLVCRGVSGDKATFLYGLLTEHETKKDSLRWDNERLQKTVKLLLYCSSILPQKFLSLKKKDEVFRKIVYHDPSKPRRKRTSNIRRSFASDSGVDHGYIWSEKEIQNKEHIFEDVFNQFFVERFQKKVFPKGTESASKSQFVLNFISYSHNFDMKNIQNVTAPAQNIGWLFSHVKVNFVFKQYLY